MTSHTDYVPEESFRLYIQHVMHHPNMLGTTEWHKKHLKYSSNLIGNDSLAVIAHPALDTAPLFLPYRSAAGGPTA